MYRPLEADYVQTTNDDDHIDQYQTFATQISSSVSCRDSGSEQDTWSNPPLHQGIHPLPLTTTLPLLVFVDMVAVAAVIPQLFQYYQMAGVTNARQRELLASLFSFSQIIGGLLLGAFIDAKRLTRRSVLYLSFGGSAIAYAMMTQSSFGALVSSRILVGLVKQTMTITKTMLTRCTTQETRAQHMGRLSASATAAWVLGPSVGAVLFEYVDYRAPAIFASLLFIINMILAAMLLPKDDDVDETKPRQSGRNNSEHEEKKASVPNTPTPSPFNRKRCLRTESGTLKTTSASTCASFDNGKRSTPLAFLSNLEACFASKVLGCLVCANLVLTWVARSTNSNNLSTFYEDLYGLEPHYRGYISSYQQILGFITESFLITPCLQLMGGERKATCISALLVSIALGLQSMQSKKLTVFLGVVCPMTSLAYSVIFTSLQSLVTTVASVESIFSVLAALDVLQNAVSVSVPFYRTILFGRLASKSCDNTMADASLMYGDPDPEVWLHTCTLHWFFAALALVFLLLGNEIVSGKKVPNKTMKYD